MKAMLPPLVLASTLLQVSIPHPSTLATKVVDAIDRNYLYADGDSWEGLRLRLSADANPSVSSLDQQLILLHDGDLRIMTSGQMMAMQKETSGKERGIGLVDFAVTVEPKTGEPKVVTPLVDSPAFKVGVQPGDVIVAINGQPTLGLVHEDVIAAMRGDFGTVKIVVRRDDRHIAMEIPLAVWDEEAVVSRAFVAGNRHLGFIGVRLFTPKSGDQVRKAVESLVADGLDGCIVDLRNNPGGYLDAMAVAGSAFTDRILAWKVRRDGTKEPIHSAAKPLKVVPLVVLVNEGTASAAEILAAGLRDTTGARLVGAKTYGRGQIQTYVVLNDSVGIIIPAAIAETLRGLRFNKESGVSPDIVVSSTADKKGVDAAYRSAVDLLTHD